MNASAKQPVASQPLAFLSDVHGNLPALEAVLSELAPRGIDRIYVAGDLVYGGDEPLEVWQRLQGLKAECTRGLSDMALATVDPDSLEPSDDHERSMADRFTATRRELGDLVAERLKRLPEKIRIPLVDGSEVLLVHGAPSDPSQEITHDMGDEELTALLGDDPADVIVCGASHVPFDRQLEGVRIVNVGSVGAAPEGRIAHYTVLVPKLEGCEVQQQWVEY